MLIPQVERRTVIEATKRDSSRAVSREYTYRQQRSYSYEHSAFALAYTKDNLAHVIYPSGIKQSDWIHDLPQLVKENWAVEVTLEIAGEPHLRILAPHRICGI